MKVVLEQEAINEINSLLNELPIKSMSVAQAIVKVLDANIEKDEEPTTATVSDNT